MYKLHVDSHILSFFINLKIQNAQNCSKNELVLGFVACQTAKI